MPVIARVLKQNNLRAKGGKRKKWHRKNDEETYRAEYLAKDKNVDEFMELVCADITEMKVSTGKIYCSGIIDVKTRMIVGYTLSPSVKQEIVQESIEYMLGIYGKPKIYHCDRGSQYTAIKTKRMLESKGIQISMSRPHTPRDNYPIESFWHTMKTELSDIDFKDKDYEEAKEIIEMYITYYNTERIHSAINYMTPLRSKTLLSLGKESSQRN